MGRHSKKKHGKKSRRIKDGEKVRTSKKYDDSGESRKLDPNSKHFDGGEESRHFYRRQRPKHFDGGEESRHFYRGPRPKHFDGGEESRHFYRGPRPKHFDGGEESRHFYHGPRPKHFDSGVNSGKVSWNEVKMSKMLVSILRHRAKQLNIYMDTNGFVKLKDLLIRREFRHLTAGDIKRMVNNNDKRRFSLKEKDGELMIRANQGHSIQVENLDLKPILSSENYPNVIHGTYYKSWVSIRKTGLSRMTRMHIHFATGEPSEIGVISGMRSSCQVMIHLNLNLALKDGLTFYESENNVILTEGDEHGVISPKYFEKVVDRTTRREIY